MDEKKELTIKIPNPIATLYCVKGFLVNDFYKTFEEAYEYVKWQNEKYNEKYDIERWDYIGSFAQKDDVFKVEKIGLEGYILKTTNKSDFHDFHFYINSDSVQTTDKLAWNNGIGSLAKTFTAFRTIGVIFNDDVFIKHGVVRKGVFHYQEEHFNRKQKKIKR